MEYLIYALLIYLAYVAVRWVIINVILPVGKWAAIVLAVAGTIIGAFVALKSYAKSIKENINPYKYYEDNSKNKQEYAKRRSYFFGPGLLQLKKTVSDAWKGIGESVEWVFQVRTTIGGTIEIPIIKQAAWLFSWLFALCALITIGILGGAITCALSVIHATILFVVMAIIYILFSVTWLVDRIYLQAHSVKASCPYCQVRSVVPMFQCPKCGSMHSKLVPGPYGIWHRQCTCGEKLPTTFLLGRSKLKAFCPSCGNELAASDVQQFSISLVGGTSSGKTVLLTSFFHDFFKILDTNKNMYYEIPQLHADMFDNLDQWFNGAYCDATRVTETAEMYSVLLNSGSLEMRKQFSVYDIAGEAFDDPKMESMLPMYQLRDSNGMVLVIDPLSSIEVREKVIAEGGDTSNYSNVDSAAVLTNYVTYLNTVLTNKGLGKKSDKPVAVVITKIDIPVVDSQISYQYIKNTFEANPGMFESFAQARDSLCEEFLRENGFYDVVNAITINCNNVHYFPVSAIGHASNGRKYTPENVLEPFSWLICETEPALAELIGLENPNT